MHNTHGFIGRSWRNSVLVAAIGTASMAIAPLAAAVTDASAEAGVQATLAPQVIGKEIFGLMRDASAQPLRIDGKSVIHPQADESHPLALGRARFELGVFSDLIGGLYLTKLDPKRNEPVDTRYLSVLDVAGVASPGGVTETPWQTALLTEQTAIDAADPGAFKEKFGAYFSTNFKADASASNDDRPATTQTVNPYAYGWPLEAVVLDESGAAKIVKHYAMGRTASEQALVMPDQKSVWLQPAARHDTLLLFVAEAPANLTAGRLFAVDFSGSAPQPVELAHTTAIKAKFRLRRASLERLLQRESVGSDGACESPLQLVNAGYGNECVAIKDKRNAGLFEPYRVAAIKGVDNYPGGVTRLQYDASNNTLIVTDREGSEQRWGLESDSESNSDYMLRRQL